MTPEGWRALKFGDVASLEYGKSLPATQRNGGSVVVCGASGIVGFHDEALVPGPGIVIGRKGSVGAVTWLKSDFWPIDTTYYLSAREEVDVRWLFYAASHLRLERLNEATGIPGLNRNTAASLKFNLPTLPEQRKIAIILSSVDDAIEKTQAVIDQVQVVKQGLMQELLRRGLPGRHTRFKQTEIGEIPESWATSSIGEIAGCDYGTSEALQTSGRGIPILRMGNLQDGRVNLDDAKYLATERVRDELLLSSGDVLFNRTNSAELVGKVAVFDHRERVSFASYLLRLRVKAHVGSGFWLSYLLNTGELQRRLRSTATLGVSQVNINRRSLLATVVPVPPLEEQAAIVSILNSVSHKIEVEQGGVDHLTEVKSALMSVLLTGELRVIPDGGVA